MKKCKHKNFVVSAQKEIWASFFYKDGAQIDKKETVHGFNHHTTEVVCTDCNKPLDVDEWTDAMYDAFGEIGV